MSPAAAARQPQDHKPKSSRKRTSPLKAEALDLPVTFTYGGEDWTVVPRQASSLEFLAGLQDEEYITAVRALLGRDEAARLFRGRTVEDLGGFFDAMGEAVGLGNP